MTEIATHRAPDGANYSPWWLWVSTTWTCPGAAGTCQQGGTGGWWSAAAGSWQQIMHIGNPGRHLENMPQFSILVAPEAFLMIKLAGYVVSDTKTPLFLAMNILKIPPKLYFFSSRIMFAWCDIVSQSAMLPKGWHLMMDTWPPRPAARPPDSGTSGPAAGDHHYSGLSHSASRRDYTNKTKYVF